MVVNYSFTVFYDVCIWLYLPGGFMTCFRKSICKRMRLSTQKLLAEMQDALDWTQRRPRLPLPQCCTLPAQSWPSSSSPGTDALCPLNMLQITLLPGKSVLFLCLISWHFSKISEGGSASSIRRAHHNMSQRSRGIGALQRTKTHSPVSSPANPCWTSLPPHMTSTGLCFWGAGGGCVCVHSCDPSRTRALQQVFPMSTHPETRQDQPLHCDTTHTHVWQ